jgi:hypothetical protein
VNEQKSESVSAKLLCQKKIGIGFSDYQLLKKIGIGIGFSNCDFAEKNRRSVSGSATATLLKKTESNKLLTVNENTTLPKAINFFEMQQPYRLLGLRTKMLSIKFLEL